MSDCQKCKGKGRLRGYGNQGYGDGVQLGSYPCPQCKGTGIHEPLFPTNVDIRCPSCNKVFVTTPPVRPFNCIACGALITKANLVKPMLSTVEAEK